MPSKYRQKKAAYALYEYDVIIINPKSYSHFIFGSETEHSDSDRELWDLKAENNNFDLDTVYDQYERSKELAAAISQGTRVIWLLAKQKNIKFFGMRSVFSRYANDVVKKLVETSTLHEKKSRQLSTSSQVGEFEPYFVQLMKDGWSLCLSDHNDSIEPFATTPENYTSGGRVKIESAYGWLLTPPSTQEGMDTLIKCVVGVDSISGDHDIYHGIFLSHNSEDKPFVRELKKSLEAHGVKKVWLDEAEIMVGDSLIKKIDEGLKNTKFIGIVLSPRSVKSTWVEKELEVALNREISSGEVVVLPLLYEKCDLPAFLAGKLYADFTSPAIYDEGLAKLLRRLKKQI